MPESFTVTTTANVGGSSYENKGNDQAASLERATPLVPAAVAGTLTTRTDNTNGTATLAAGHGFVTNDSLDIYWTNSDGTSGSRRGTSATVTGNSVALTGGTGDNYPVANTAVTAARPVSVPFSVGGDSCIGIAASLAGSQKWGTVVFLDITSPTPAAIFAIKVGPTSSYVWSRNQGTTNPLAGKTTSAILVSHGDTKARNMTVLAVFNP